MQEIPTSGLAKFITDLAKEHDVTYAKTNGDQLAEKFTELSGDEVILDNVECLIIALERAGAINSEDVVPLHVNYLREKFKQNTPGSLDL
jgi:hypothetical protein